MSKKTKTDFSDLSEQDAVGVVVNTGVLAGMAHECIKAYDSGKQIAILITGWTLNDDGIPVRPQKAIVDGEKTEVLA